MPWLKKVIEENEIDYIILGHHFSKDEPGSLYNGNMKTPDQLYTFRDDIIEGMETVDKIVKSRVITRSPYGGGKDRPVEPPVMKKVTVETFGVDYDEPKKLMD